jgi:Tfp pilus assembly protein PilZ
VSSDSRAHPRYALEVDAEVRNGAQVIPVRTSDVSRGGMAMSSQHPVPMGTEVMINMALVFDEETFSEPLLLKARVVWCTKIADRHQIGTSFIGMTAEQRHYLEMFLRYLKEGKRQEAAAQDARDGVTGNGSDDDDEPFG